MNPIHNWKTVFGGTEQGLVPTGTHSTHRKPDKAAVAGCQLPFILMRHWDEWQESKTLTIDDTDRRLCRLAMEIQYRCQHFFFGEMAYNYFEDQGKEFTQRRRTSRYEECFRKLPDEFKTQQFMECFGITQSAASRAITRLQKDDLVEKVKYGLYRKVVQDFY